MTYPYYPYYPYNYSTTTTYTPKLMEWVAGEKGAKDFQMPAGISANTPIALWDNTEQRIFLKSWNAIGVANPIQVLTYEMKDQPLLMEGNDNNQYVTKNDLDELRQEIRNLMNSRNNNNNSQTNQPGKRSDQR